MTTITNSSQPQIKTSTLVGVGAVVLAILGIGCAVSSPAPRLEKPVAPTSVESCKNTFDALVSDTITSIDPDEAGSCASHFSAWAKSIPDTAYAVKGGTLEVRGGSYSLVGAQFWRTKYWVGEVSLPAVLVVTDTTAATLRFQKAADADVAFALIEAAAASK